MLGARLSRRRGRGFTLVELMIVVAIIMVLTGLIIPRYVEVTDTAKKAKCHGNISTLNTAAAMYFASHGQISSSLQELTPNFVVIVPTCPYGLPYVFDGYCITNVGDHDH